MRPSPIPENLGDGVWSVPVPIPGSPLGYTLVYALESAKGPVLVDAGWEHPDAWAALRGGLSTLGLDVTEVSGVVVTHYHPDHAGLAGRVREASGAWIAMHHADADIIRLFHDMVRDGTGHAVRLASARRAGAGDGDQVTHAGEQPDPPAVPDRELADGDLVDLPGRKLRVVWTPGHSPGHICLHLEDGDRIFTGDHVLPRITPHIGLYPYDLPDVDPLGDFLDSLERIEDIEAGEVLPAHQYRFNDLSGRAREIGAHHEERLVEVTGLLGDRPSTLWELAAAMKWRSPWEAMSSISRQMAAGEAAAHLRTLERRGVARRYDGDDPIRFVLR
ncbi:MBL fold metallo-hydrolase [Actinomadura sp. HBU206391]|uniref:MBL fold metallo-hydrolase n=1 Tax=Actinomadura sp. HBU206391 TaxID=2731692 RepID=UPI001650A343|nr:MBL fold metallo-hydrolase [Actinomadura sp. HBU206391]MBC6463019.1 MBL fold metallo-hydrolase [Actinomadura sp. HBU206391]